MINKKIFTIWLNDNPKIPEFQKNCIEKQKIEGYEHTIFMFQQPEPILVPFEYFNDCVYSRQWVKACDFLRMYLLYRDGGIYLDADVEILPGKNFDDMLNDKLFIGLEKTGYYNTGIVGAEAGHPLLKQYLERVNDNFKGFGDLIFEPGIRAFTDLIFISDKEKLGIKTYPEDYFYPFDHSSGQINITENTRVFHHFTKSWLN